MELIIKTMMTLHSIECMQLMQCHATELMSQTDACNDNIAKVQNQDISLPIIKQMQTTNNLSKVSSFLPTHSMVTF